MKLLAKKALLSEGWADDVLIEIDSSGSIVATIPGSSASHDAERVNGFVVPGMPNLHSHAFQRAMAGLTERRSHAVDSFWTWRQMMYHFAASITADQMQAIATYLYVEMLKAGFTSVAEFHYLHHDRAGKAYADGGEMSHRLIAAAEDAGIAITLLPVMYAYSGFGAQSPTPGQARFVHSVDTFAALLEALGRSHGRRDNVRIGLAFHSLRAIDRAIMHDVIAVQDRLDATAPIHIHVAEQVQEVDDCLRWSGKRPVEWLLDNAPVGERWCLVHATHLNANEINRLGASGAIAGLCPTTEANLGDGIFPAAHYLAASGRAGIGSDSHIVVSVSEELRTLEYGERLISHRRAALASADTPSPGERMHRVAADGGARALGLATGEIMPGRRADLVVLDPEHRAFWNANTSHIIDAWVFAGNNACVRDAMVAGRWCIRDRRHVREDAIAAACRGAQSALVSAS